MIDSGFGNHRPELGLAVRKIRDTHRYPTLPRRRAPRGYAASLGTSRTCGASAVPDHAHLLFLALSRASRFMSLLRLVMRASLSCSAKRRGWDGSWPAPICCWAGAQFAEPVLFGSIVRCAHSGKPAAGTLGDNRRRGRCWRPWRRLACSPSCATPRWRCTPPAGAPPAPGVLTNYFEHIMQLPLTFHHTGTHSARLMKVMLNGTDSLWRRCGSGSFREHFAAIMSVVVLLRWRSTINWRLAILRFVLCVVVHGCADHAGGAQDPTACKARSKRITATSRRAPRTRSATWHWCRASCGSMRGCRGCALSPTSSWRYRCRCCHWWALVTP